MNLQAVLKTYTLVFLTLIATLFSNCGSDEDEIPKVAETPEEMGEVLFNAIKNEDAPVVRTYIAVESDIDEILEKTNLSEKKRKKKKKKIKKRIEQLNDELAKKLSKIKEKEIDWENTTYDWVEYKNFEKDSLTGADIYIVFSEDKKQYKIKLEECYPTTRGWVIFDDITFNGKKK